MNEEECKFIENTQKEIENISIHLFMEYFFEKREMIFSDIVDIILSTYIPACANVLKYMANYTGNQEIINEMDDFVIRLIKSVPSCKVEIEKINE